VFRRNFRSNFDFRRCRRHQFPIAAKVSITATNM
jgi:hypothetical protein